jgi:hypothetical protein
MQTVIIDIINSKVLKLLQDLELLQLIKLRSEKVQPNIPAKNRIAKYKGAMSKQPLTDIDNQLKHLRSEWD